MKDDSCGGVDPLHTELTLVAQEMHDHLYELEQLQGTSIETIREQILSVEGRAAQRYWGAVARVIPIRKKVVQTIEQIRKIVDSEIMPPPPVTQYRCVTCEFRRFCNDVV